MSEGMGQNDHDWLAFRYVAGEMTVEEAAEFECLLSENQPAREAVAAAVQLSQAVELAARNARPDRQEVVPAPRGHRALTWRQRLVWASIGAAASLLVAWGLQSWRDAGRHAPPAHEDLAGLAVQWRAAGDYDADDDEVGAMNDREPLESTADARPNAAVHDPLDDLAAPDWLLAAVGEKNMPPMNGTDGD
jgi:hypothetical protein